MSQKVGPDRQLAWARETRDLIERQTALLAKLEPGTDEHKRATSVLLMLKDSLHVLTESRSLIAAAKSALSKTSKP